MKNLHFVLIPATLLFLQSCLKDIDVNTEVKSPKLVLNAMIDPQDTMVINLSSSLSITDRSNLHYISDAEVVMTTKNGENYNLEYINSGNYILKNYLPSIGDKYSFTVKHKDFATISASDIIPEKPIIGEIDTIRKNVLNDPQMNFTIRIKDPTVTNYYKVEIIQPYYEKQWPSEDSVLVVYNAYLSSNDPFIEGANANGYNDEFLLLSDQNFNGTDYLLKFSTSVYNVQDPNQLGVKLRITALSEASFNYQKSFRKYEQSDGNPFANPVQVFCNVEGGFGILGGNCSVEIDL